MIKTPVVCVVTCRDENGIASHLDMAYAAVGGGANMIQIRDKAANTSTLTLLANEIKRVIGKKKIALIMNDNVEAAVRSNCDGVHLGAEDMQITEARHLLGSSKIIGASAGNIQEARSALLNGADYLGVGPVFVTATKDDAGEPIGLAALKKICKLSSSAQIIAIGGITKENLAAVMDSGASGVAVISEISGSEDKTSAVQALVERVINPVVSTDKLESYAKNVKN